MKLREFRKLIREEVRRVVNEVEREPGYYFHVEGTDPKEIFAAIKLLYNTDHPTWGKYTIKPLTKTPTTDKLSGMYKVPVDVIKTGHGSMMPSKWKFGQALIDDYTTKANAILKKNGFDVSVVGEEVEGRF
jgi:hypothetical protein